MEKNSTKFSKAQVEQPLLRQDLRSPEHRTLLEEHGISQCNIENQNVGLKVITRKQNTPCDFSQSHFRFPTGT